MYHHGRPTIQVPLFTHFGKTASEPNEAVPVLNRIFDSILGFVGLRKKEEKRAFCAQLSFMLDGYVYCEEGRTSLLFDFFSFYFFSLSLCCCGRLNNGFFPHVQTCIRCNLLTSRLSSLSRSLSQDQHLSLTPFFTHHSPQKQQLPEIKFSTRPNQLTLHQTKHHVPQHPHPLPLRLPPLLHLVPVPGRGGRARVRGLRVGGLRGGRGGGGDLRWVP